MPPEQQAVTLSAGGPGTGTCWTAILESPTELAQNVQWRMATALRLGAAPDAGPRSTCGLRKGNDGDVCEQSLAAHPSHPFCCKYGGARNRPHRAVQSTLRRLIDQVEGYADMERHVLELYDFVKNKDETAPVMRCAIFDVVSWFPGVLQQLWMDVSVRCPHAEGCNESASQPWVAAVAGETEITQRYGTAVRSLVFETYGRLGGEDPSCCVIWWPRRRQMDSTAQTPLDDGGPSWSGCCWLRKQTHSCEHWVPELRSVLLLTLLCCWQSRACTVLFGGAWIATLM